MSKFVLAAIAALAMPMAASAATVTLDSQAGGNVGQLVKNNDGSFRLDQGASSIVYLDLSAGTYDITAKPGTYTSWNRWNTISGCDANGANCSQGYEWSMSYFLPAVLDGAGAGYVQSTDVNFSGPGDRTFFASGQLAYDAISGAPITTLTLDFAQTVGFFINDDIVGDNNGGVQFDITLAPVPLPATGLMLAGGVVAFGALRRRRKAA